MTLKLCEVHNLVFQIHYIVTLLPQCLAKIAYHVFYACVNHRKRSVLELFKVSVGEFCWEITFSKIPSYVAMKIQRSKSVTLLFLEEHL